MTQHLLNSQVGAGEEGDQVGLRTLRRLRAYKVDHSMKRIIPHLCSQALGILLRKVRGQTETETLAFATGKLFALCAGSRDSMHQGEPFLD